MTDPAARHPDLNYGEAERAERRSRADGPWNLDHLKLCWLVLLAAGVVMTVLGGVLGGSRGLYGSAVGILIVGVFFTFSTVIVARVGRRAPRAVLAAALGAYVVKIVILGIVIIALPADGPLSPRWMALAVVVGLVTWMSAHLRYIWTAKVFYADPS